MKEATLRYAKEHLIGFLFSVLFGAIATIALFYFTAAPSSSSEVKKKLETILLDKLHEFSKVKSHDIQFNSVISQSLDLSTNDSVFVYATTEQDGDIYRVLGIFESKRQNILDKLVGRSGFYRLASFSIIPVPYSNNLLPENIKIEDYDLDGNKEILVFVKSVWADSTSSGVIVLKKNDNEVWSFLSIPSLSNKLSELLSGKPPHPEGLKPVSSPTIWFGSPESPEADIEDIRKAYSNYSIYEDEWQVSHNGVKSSFITLRNGGQIKENRHPFGNHLQLGVAANVVDDNAVLDVHHIFITFLKLGETDLETDVLWNWGFPMLSVAPEELSAIDLNEFHNAGISSHLLNGTFFGYTEFERIRSQ